MTSSGDSQRVLSGFLRQVEGVLKAHACTAGSIGIARAPGVVDVMGGIGEDSGGLVLTATAALSFHAAAWQTGGDRVRLRFLPEASEEGAAEFAVPAGALAASEEAGEALLNRCREAGAQWAAPSLLAVQELVRRAVVPEPRAGLCLVVMTDLPEEADLGRHCVQAAATVDAVCRLYAAKVDRLVQSESCAAAIGRMTGLYCLRKSMTALCGPPRGALLQLRFHPQLLCDRLELPRGIIVQAVSTRLSRPTTLQRLLETRTCSEMGHRMILDLQRQDGAAVNPKTSRLASITPAEYVERYRDRMPSKVTHEAFVSRFGTLRGLDDGNANPKGIYKIRSRAEHHIYENRRVHDFATHLSRGRRTRAQEALAAAGELMYASHWSHSQRCGIGGVETDRIVNFVRGHGAAAGLFGAKVTAGGAGGELVVLMRDDAEAHAALADAVARAEKASQKPVRVFEGSLPGAASFEPSELPGRVRSPSVV